MPHRICLSAAAMLVLASTARADDEPAAANVVVVSGSRVEHSRFDLPAAIDVLDSGRIGDGQLRVNASEALSAIPGLVVQNRQNYAQDLQISSRGFGARSTFGVRGVHLVSDGIPASMPDGQGQAATFNLDMAERIEVLRGPFSAMYGNHAGGVIQLFTRDPRGAPAIEVSMAAGSDGTRKTDTNAHGQLGAVGFVVDASRFDTNGFRLHSAARRDQTFAKLQLAPWKDATLTLVANGLRQADTQDPLGVTWATYQRDPRALEMDPSDNQTPKRSFAERYNTRKSIDHQQIGASLDQRFGDDQLHLMLYGGNRQVSQFQAFSKAFQAPASHSGGVVDFDRDFSGADLRWTSARELGGGTLRTSLGVEYGHSRDARKGFENFIGVQLGVRGALRRDEQDDVSSTDPYLQAEWQSGPWVANAGMRHSQLNVYVHDQFLANGNDSGHVAYSNTTPFLALLYKMAPAVNVYASAARGFETPTLNELFYSGSGAGFNFALKPARSAHWEAGLKSLIGSSTQLNASLFQVNTKDELVVDAAVGGRTSYRNASRTRREGMELALETHWSTGWSAHLATTVMRAIFDDQVGAVKAGSRLPGVAGANLFGELAWKNAGGQVDAALETIASGKVYADDANADQPAPGYAILNARIVLKQKLNGWQCKQFVRLNNLMDRRYVGSVIVGDTNRRYYEAAPGRNWMVGASVQATFQ